MLKSHEKFHSANGKRKILVADDETINREILKAILEDEYEVLPAEDGTQALQMIYENADSLSLILLDLMMPGLTGQEVLKRQKEDPSVSQIPVMVLTADETAEVESLSLGAIDFIPKPYPQVDVIKARVRKTIELSEDRQIIEYTERDPLTNLYNKEYFYRYSEQYDQHHRDAVMDAIVVDINHFHMLNERYGRAYADEVLKKVGQKIREYVFDNGGIVCRREADTFLIYCPHIDEPKKLLESTSDAMSDEEENNRIRLRMGVYAEVDKSIDIERRFDRAKMAADTVRNSFARNIGYYDSSLHEAEIFSEQLIDDFRAAIDDKQFTVFYQPKFDVRTEIPVLTSAEALVRWNHPELGMVSPGMFIPLFEENGLIQELDSYVWREAARQIKDWKERFDFVVPVSVNVSRIDMYDPELINTLKNILEENELSASDLLLEITESAYTQDSGQIIETVNKLREIGFKIEMDDFGTGYSSLNMISTLPIDALKLDMQFIRNAFNDRKDIRMLEVIIDIADYLSVPVIAEGVETEDQMRALRDMGCDIVQGYYFSRPVPAEEYEAFVMERNNLGTIPEASDSNKPGRLRREREQDEMEKDDITFALSSGFESIYYVDIENGHYLQFSSQGEYKDLQIENSGSDFFGDARKNFKELVYEKDQARVELSMEKETLLTQMIGTQPFTMTYRLMVEDVPTYYNLKAVRSTTRDDHHIVIGVGNVDAVIREALGDDMAGKQANA